MNRRRDDMATSPGMMSLVLATCHLIALCNAGPLGPLPNVTSSELGLTRQASCALGDVVYMAGDEFPGAGPCERCTCGESGVQCARQTCAPRAGCKAVHRPDHCCPTYQCECEQEGRIYDNGEKLVDPLDPCRVCYCQGGEVVCRRIACFVRDDCRPRLVPGRCCPEYDNCPLRGVTTIPGLAPSIATTEDLGTSAVPSTPKENVKQEITIKEITPVSEIPVITEVKIKQILPSPSIEVAEYASSKSPLIPREVTSEKSVSKSDTRTEAPVIIEVKPASQSPEPSTMFSNDAKDESSPSKISLSTQDSINSEIYPSIVSSIATMGFPPVTPNSTPVASTTRAPQIEEEAPFDHNPAFPPLPDDLSVQSNHEDEIVPEQIMDNEHIPNEPEIVVTSVPLTTHEPIITAGPTTTIKAVSEEEPTITEKVADSLEYRSTAESRDVLSTQATGLKQSPMLNLRSAIPTEILNVPSLVPEEITGELDEITDITTDRSVSIKLSTTAAPSDKPEEKSPPQEAVEDSFPRKPISNTEADTTSTTTQKVTETTNNVQTTNSIAKSNIATEVTLQTELSSLPIETSDQNPHEISDSIVKEKLTTITQNPALDTSPPKTTFSKPEVTTASRDTSSNTDSQSFESVNTESPLASSAESVTDTIEIINGSTENKQKAALIETSRRKNNILTDLINLVGDVASMSEHTDAPEISNLGTGTAAISESEELIPVNAGYKSKNKHYNQNSITEIPLKIKTQTQGNRQKIIEIEGEDTENIADSPPPHDKVEPTTRRPIIDNVSDSMPGNKTDKKDIEIITQSYVPTINKRPTKVVMKKSSERQTVTTESVVSEETVTEDATSSSEGFTPTDTVSYMNSTPEETSVTTQ